MLERIGKSSGTCQEESQNDSTEPVAFELNNYEAFINDMKNSCMVENARGIIRETDTDFVSTFLLKKGSAGKVLELRCPQSKAVSIFGKNQTEWRVEDKPQGFIIKEPYSFILRCFDNNNNELGQATRLNIKKVSMYGGISSGWRASYGDLSPVKGGFQFPDGVYLCSNEALLIEILNPDIDIEIISLSVEADIFDAVQGWSS